MATEFHKYWFALFIHPNDGKPRIWRLKAVNCFQSMADIEARAVLGPQNIQYVVKGSETPDNNSNYQHWKAEMMALTNDINWAQRSGHVMPNSV
jgi:hypothetical protein